MKESRSKLLIAAKMPRTLVRRLDAFAAQLSTFTPGLEVNRSEAIIVLLTFALDTKGIDAPPEGLAAESIPVAPAPRTPKKGAKRTARKP